MSDRERDLKLATELARQGHIDQAWRAVVKHVRDDPDDPRVLCVAGFVLQQQQNPLAYYVTRTYSQVAPKDTSAWINYGMVSNDLWRHSEAERAYKKGLELATDDDTTHMLYVNLAALMIDQGRFAEGEQYAKKALKVKDGPKGKSNLGFCQLARGDFENGWKNYHYCLGNEWRKRTVYKDEPEWDGSSMQTVVLYGEQGLGDEICFASMVPDAIRVSRKVILDVDARLQGLFQRSFPEAKVYGTRNVKVLDWDDSEMDCSLAMGQLGEFFRPTRESFPSEPYLVADPDRITMWKALWATKGKPVIGIAWSGGIFKTGSRYRRLQLEQLLPIFRSVDAHWVSLQYQDARQEIEAFSKKHGIDLVQYSHAVLTPDYDDTAGLVASLDAVVSVPTAVVHLADGLGTRCIAMNSPKKCWKFNAGLPFHPKVQLIDNDGWGRTISKAAEALSELLNPKQEAA